MSDLLLDDPGNEKFLSDRRWRRHPHYSGLWNRDGGDYHSTWAAIRIEREEQKQRDALRNLRAMSSDDVEVKREIAERRRREIERLGSGRVPTIHYPANGAWGERDPR